MKQAAWLWYERKATRLFILAMFWDWAPHKGTDQVYFPYNFCVQTQSANCVAAALGSEPRTFKTEKWAISGLASLLIFCNFVACLCFVILRLLCYFVCLQYHLVDSARRYGINWRTTQNVLFVALELIQSSATQIPIKATRHAATVILWRRVCCQEKQFYINY